MKIAVLGTGMVGRAIASKLATLDHEVSMGSRSADNDAASAWAEETGPKASYGTYASAAANSELVFNCTAGAASLDALEAAGRENLSGKTLIDVANPLDFSRGVPPTLALCNTDSLGEQIQRTFPQANVVKALNTMTCGVMVEPGRVSGHHNVFVCGEHGEAKRQTARLLTSFGWPEDSIIDLGGISAARGTEMYLTLWLNLYGSLDTGYFNIAVAR
jgi:predicted dinucleotide-binding enzyme